MARSPFDALAEDYHRARPDYPAGVYTALGDLRGLTVVELGAGTGIATRGLRAHGARVLATDLGIGMLRKQPAGQPRVVAVAEAIPVRSACADLVTGAQMWHWVDPVPAVAEARRVLRPGGRLAVWWNEVDVDRAPWWVPQQERLVAASPTYLRDPRRADWAAELRPLPGVASAETVTVRWSREIDPTTYRAWMRSKSHIAEIPEPTRSTLLDAEDAAMAVEFPHGRIVEPFICSLTIVTFRS
jgi:SAM-dependent methyltransferase